MSSDSVASNVTVKFAEYVTWYNTFIIIVLFCKLVLNVAGLQLNMAH